MQAGEKVLTASQLGMTYGGRQALRGLSFTLGAGRILGFLGPNGAGKTTAIRILTTIIEPTAGSFTVAGIDSRNPHGIRQRIGVLPESLGFPKRNTALEYLTYFGEHYGRSRPESRNRALGLLSEVGLAGRQNSLIGSYSRGMRQRLGIARTLLGDPEVVFLDEPTLGLDPRGQQELLLIIQRIARERGAGVVFCSHQLAEVGSVCDDVIILNEGRVVADGPVEDVTARTGAARFSVLVHPSSVEIALSTLQSQRVTVSKDRQLSGRIEVELGSEDADQVSEIRRDVLRSLLAAGVDILAVTNEASRLEEVFLSLTEGVAS